LATILLLKLLCWSNAMVLIISKEKKEPHLFFNSYVPVLLTAKYAEYLDQLIDYALNRHIIICCRADIISANGIRISEDFPLSPAQITQIIQNNPIAMSIKITLPDHLAISNNKKSLKMKVGINGLYVNSVEADDALHLWLTPNSAKKLVTEEDKKKIFREHGKKAVMKSKKFQNNKKLNKEAIMLYTSEQYKSKKQASKIIFPKIQKFATKNKITPLSTERGEQTVYGWILKYAKSLT
jgi:hypothetical protein